MSEKFIDQIGGIKVSENTNNSEMNNSENELIREQTKFLNILQLYNLLVGGGFFCDYACQNAKCHNASIYLQKN